jgi:hypothetical protein
LNLNAEQKYRDRGTKKGTRLARRNKLNLNAEQKYRDRGTKHDYRRGTRLARRNKSNPNVQQNIGTAEQKYRDHS